MSIKLKKDNLNKLKVAGEYNHLLECLNLPALLVDYQTLEIQKSNQLCALIFDLPKNKKLSKFLLLDLPAHFTKKIINMELQEFENQLVNKKGERLRTIVKVMPYHQNQGKQLLVMFKVIGGHNLPKVSYEYLQIKRMLLNLPVMLFAFDENKNFVLWNRECQRVTGFSRDEVLNNPRILNYLFPDEEYRNNLIHEWSLKGDFKDWQITIATKEGQEKIISLNSHSSSTLIPGFPSWAVGIDITEQKTTERELRESEKKLKSGNAQLRKLAITDNLTQLFNRRYIIQRLREEMERTKRYGLFFSCMMIDIDFFKKVNDQHGHLVGDYVLKRLAELIKSNLRTIDIVGRYGGDELFVILPQTPVQKARLLAERLRTLLNHTGFKTKKTTFSISMSVGVTAFPQKNNIEVDDLIACADKAMYKAKAAGRNCVKVYPRS